VAARGAGHEETNVRGYRPADLDVLLPLGVGASLCSIVVFGLFAATAIDSHRYPSAMLLWLVAIGMFYWMGRLWLMTMRGRMHDDPLVFTLRDGASRTALAAMVLTTAAAHFL
jgi:H+/Cl- antiporter ClcA